MMAMIMIIAVLEIAGIELAPTSNAIIPTT